MEDAYFMDQLERERRVNEILDSQAGPIIKVQRIVRLGIDEDEAEDMVARRQLGLGAPVYYEQLDRFDEE